MIHHPEAQKHAHDQIDDVVGKDRLPMFEDRESLPYIDAILRETMRWMPVLPVNMPHGVTDDDTFEGYFIPKGQLCTITSEELLHDEENYKDPLVFNPDRFLDAGGKLTNDMSHMMGFGFGRRICPGRYLAEGSLWSAMACLLATFNFSKLKDEEGRELGVEPCWTTGLSTHPRGFKCSITPRSLSIAETLRNAV
ncbi:cytochrome P450, partial [Coniophora puteana RWD-64-598 SS2]